MKIITMLSKAKSLPDFSGLSGNKLTKLLLLALMGITLNFGFGTLNSFTQTPNWQLAKSACNK